MDRFFRVQRYKKYLIYANFWGVEGGKPENPDRPDRCAHPEPCGEESGQLYCPETTKKEKYKEIYANFRGMEGGKPENPDRQDRCAHPEPCGEESGHLSHHRTCNSSEKQHFLQKKRHTSCICQKKAVPLQRKGVCHIYYLVIFHLLFGHPVFGETAHPYNPGVQTKNTNQEYKLKNIRI